MKKPVDISQYKPKKKLVDISQYKPKDISQQSKASPVDISIKKPLAIQGPAPAPNFMSIVPKAQNNSYKPADLLNQYIDLNNQYNKELDPIKKRILETDKNDIFQKTLSNSAQMSKLKPEDIEYIKANPQDYIKALEKEQNTKQPKTAQNDLGKAFLLGVENVGQGIAGVVDNASKFVSSNVYNVLSDVSNIAGDLTSLGGKFNNPVSDWFEKTEKSSKNLAGKILEQDYVGNWKENTKERLQSSELQQKVGSFIEAGSGLIPSIAVNSVLPGSGLALMGTAAAGGSASEGYRKSGDIDNALLYGALSGGVEIATEKLFAGIPMLQKGGVVSTVINKVTNSLNQNPALKKAIVSGADIAGEGLEEAISTFVDPYLQRATNVDPKASNATGAELMQSAVMGGLLSLAMKGGYKAADLIAGKQNLSSATTKPVNNGLDAKQSSIVLQTPFKDGEQIKNTAINDSAEGHTEQQNKIISEYKNAVNADLVDYIKTIRETPNSKHMNFTTSPVTQTEVSKIKDLVGIDITGFEHNIKPSAIQHIDKRHGINGNADHSMTNVEDMARIDYVVNNADSIESSLNEKGEQRYSKEFKNADGSDAKTVLYSKAIDGTFYVVEAVPDSKAKKLQLVSAYISKNKKGAYQVPDTHPKVFPRRTSENELEFTPYDTSISRDNKGVNSYDMQGDKQNSKNTDTFGKNTIGAAERNPNSYSAMQNDFGTIEPGENPYRVVDVPKSTEKGNKVRKFTRTIMEAEATPNDMLDAFETKVAEGFFSYKPRKDKASLAAAVKTIEDKGYEGALSQWSDVTNGRRTASKDDIVLGETLYSLAAKNGDAETAMKLAGELSAELTHAGQAVQAARLLKKSSPEGKLYYAKKSVEYIQEELTRKYKDKAPDIKIDNKLVKEYLETANGGTEAEQNIVLDKIYQNVADQVSVTLADKWNSWRYLAMLGNTRTHIRNVIGNGLFYLTTKSKNFVGTGIEAGTNKILSKLGKEQIERTKTLNLANKSQKDFAKADYKQMESVLTGAGKYNPADIIKDKRKIFKSKLLAPVEALRKLNNYGLEAEDAFFLRLNYVDSMSKYLVANKIDPNAITETQLETARSYALNEAQKATFRDASQLATVLNRTTNTNAFTKVLLGGTIPFTKTPINIAKRAIEYSPVGAVKAVKEMLVDVKRGDKTAAQAIDSLSSGLTGSGIMALGFALAQMGLVSGGNDEDKKQEGFDKLQGAQNYALETGDGSYTIDWAAPTAIPLFMGVEMFNLSNDSGNTFENIINSITTLSDPLVEMSVLQGINSTINTIKYDENPMSALLMNSVANYTGQAVPTGLGHIARTVDDTRRSTYVEKGKIKAIDTTVQKSLAKIPFASKNLQPMIDTWGREVKNEGGNGFSRYLYNSLSPGYYKGKNTTALDTELERIYKKGVNENPYPAKAEKSFQANGETVNLTAEQYTKYAKEKGTLSYNIANKLIADDNYKKLSDEEKAELIKKVYDYSNAVAKTKVSDYNLSDSYKKMYEAVQKNIEPHQYLYIKQIAGSDATKKEMKEVLDNANLTYAQKAYMWASQNSSWKSNPYR